MAIETIQNNNFESFIVVLEEKLQKMCKFRHGLSQSNFYDLEPIRNDQVPLAPWSTPSDSILHLHASGFLTKEDAIHHIDSVIQCTSLCESFQWSPTEEGAEDIIWPAAPHPSWNGFIKRQTIQEGRFWRYHVTIALAKAYAVTNRLQDIRLVLKPGMALPTISYTFGLSFDLTGSDGELAALLRSVDYDGVCERLSIVRDEANFGTSCALTISRLGTGERPYSLDAARDDMRTLVESLNNKEQMLVRFTQPAVNLCSEEDLTKDLILSLAGGKEILAISMMPSQSSEKHTKNCTGMKNFVDGAVCKRLRDLENLTTFWTDYEHELYDKKTGQKRYESYGVWRPQIAYPFNRTYLEPLHSEEWQKYFGSSRALTGYLRHMLRPYDYPIDRFLSALDSIINTNILIHPQFRKKMQAGMLRLMPNDSFTGIHVDRPPDASLGQFRHILSTNFYTAPSSSAKGGELLIWDAPSIHFGSDPTNVKRDFVSLNLCPEEGDAIMICPELPHAIARVVQGKRLSVNVFLALVADEDRLCVWN